MADRLLTGSSKKDILSSQMLCSATGTHFKFQNTYVVGANLAEASHVYLLLHPAYSICAWLIQIQLKGLKV